jgi:hypothetical protein
MGKNYYSIMKWSSQQKKLKKITQKILIGLVRGHEPALENFLQP